MLHARQDVAFGCSIAFQFISDDHVWDVLEPFEVVRFPVDLEIYFIQVSLVSRFRATMFQLIGVRLTTFQTPLSHRFVGQHDPTLCHHLFDITETQGRAEIQPDVVRIISAGK
jgi:hypothetical protein